MMKVRFKNSDVNYDCTEPVEQKLFRSGVACGWAIMFHLRADFSSSEVDDVITTDNISELTFTNDAETKTVVTDYAVITNCTIRHKSDKSIVELQFTKACANQTKEENAEPQANEEE